MFGSNDLAKAILSGARSHDQQLAESLRIISARTVATPSNNLFNHARMIGSGIANSLLD